MADTPPEQAVFSQPSEQTVVRGELLFQAIAADFGDPQLAQVKATTLAKLLREVPIFSRLDEGGLRRVCQRAKVARVSARQVIVREGTSSQTLYVLLTGAVTLSKNGRELGRLGRGACFGELGLLDGAPRPHTVTAERDLWLVKVSASDLQVLVDEEPRAARSLIAALSDGARRAQGDVAD